MAEYTIQELSQRFHMKASALRYYEECGLLGEIERSASGQRIYSSEDVGRIESIVCFKDAGMTIDEIRRFFAYEADEAGHIEDMLILLRKRQQTIEAQRIALEQAYHHVQQKVGYYSAVQHSIHTGGQHPQWSDFSQ
ncbi:MAG: MerR family transcriptional regulator [Bifidobacterium sp.]|jgi:DNA-binding transcriptional MerR regulator|nr:MerR family transcriptional regulator [Bifidobacterium sp.]MCH4175000.1 MerR family transcriptional regulator [Bifidobacterium sp.]